MSKITFLDNRDKLEITNKSASAITNIIAGGKQSLTVNDVSPLEHKCSCKLVSASYTSGSKNIYKFNSNTLEANTSDTASFTINENGTITLNGYADNYGSPWGVWVTLKDLIAGETYTLSLRNNNKELVETNMAFAYYSEGNETMIDTMLGLSKYTFTPENNVDYYQFYWLVYAGESNPFVNETFYPQLELGTAVTAWEEYSVNIKNIIDKNSIYAECRNAYDYDGLINIKHEDGSITVKGTMPGYDGVFLYATLNNLENGKQYTVSVRDSKNTQLTFRLIGFKDPQGATTFDENLLTSHTFTFNSDEVDYYAFECVLLDNGDETEKVFEETTYYIQLEEGSQMTDWSPVGEAKQIPYVTDFSTVKVIANDEFYMPNADGIVTGIISKSPVMTITTDNKYVNIANFTYNVDTKSYVDNNIPEVNLSEYVKKEYVDSNFIKTKAVPSELIVTLKPNGSTDTLGFDMNNTNYSIARRDGNGCIKTSEPTDNLHAATKGYVDNTINGAVSNVIDKLELVETAVLYTEQTLTDEQKTQVRINLGLETPSVEPTTEKVTYHYDGDDTSDKYTWVYGSSGARIFVKVADLPNGNIELSGGHIDVTNPKNNWVNYSFDITDEILSTSVTKDGVKIPAVTDGLTQIIYQGPPHSAPFAVAIICTKTGYYDIAFESWMEKVQFLEKGIYLFDNSDYGGSHYAETFTCTVTTKSSNDDSDDIKSPIKYKGNEIQVFNRGICIGDSITEGVFNHSNGETVIKKYSYPSVLNKITGVDIVNAGVAGLTSETWYQASLNSDTQYGRWVNNEWVWNTAPEVTEPDIVSTSLDYSGFDFAVIHLGINDIGLMGNLTVDEAIAKFETNINNIISKLKTSSNGIKIFLATIIPCYSVNGNSIYETLNNKIKEIVNATEDVFLIDLNKYSECLDGTSYENQHLTAIGYHKMASEIASYISYIINQNLDDFKWIQFINTPYIP